VLVLVAGLPWAFGGVDPVFELIYSIGIALLVLLWACVACLNGRLSFSRCPITFVLACLFVLGALQLIPLPHWLLSVVSPGAASINAEMLPTEPEWLTSTEPAPAPSAMRPISMYPHATRASIFHWLEALILFAVIRHQLASVNAMRRLAYVAILTGIGIALFGLYQTFRYGEGTALGYATMGRVFGPFINRNHAAAFLNLCIGLGIGLLVYQGTDVSEYRRRAVQKPNAVQEQEEASVFSPLAVLHSPAQLWILVALTVLGAGLLCTLSRGGVACLALALFVAFALRMSWPPRVGRLEYFILPAILIAGLLAWLGIKPLETRLATLWKSDVLVDGRWQIWTNLIRLAPMFPVFGSGYGTLQYVEPLSRQQADLLQMPGILIDHAHNDYLEGLIEGGLIRLALTALLVSFVFVYGFRALRRYAGRKPAGWAFGGLIAFLSLALHSTVDFSLQTPAVAVLAVSVCAYLVALNRSDPNGPPSAAHPTVLTLRFPAAGLVAVSVCALTIAGVLILHAWKAEQAFRFRLAAFRALQRVTPPDLDQAILYLESAVRVAPTDADLQLELGQVFLDRTKPNNPKRLSESIIPGMRHMIEARNDCVLLPRPQMRLAANAKYLYRADPPDAYWRRAERLAPSDPDFWYLRGLSALKENRLDEAWTYWQRSLQLSPRHLKGIVDGAFAKLGIEQLLAKILPDDAELLFLSAEQLQDAAPPADLKKLYRRVGEVLDPRGEELSANEFFLKARSAEQIGETDKALRSYKLALDMNDNQQEWRWRYARLLHRTGRLKEARYQLTRLLRAWPHRNDVKEELEAVEREIEIG
jgi:tetratricopeptide (TPR) repeat protein